MGDERLVLFNLTGVTRRHLFEAARSMVDEEHYGPAVVVAQAAVRMGMEAAISFGLSASEVPNALQAWIEESTVTSWSSTDGRAQRPWRA